MSQRTMVTSRFNHETLACFCSTETGSVRKLAHVSLPLIHPSHQILHDPRVHEHTFNSRFQPRKPVSWPFQPFTSYYLHNLLGTLTGFPARHHRIFQTANSQKRLTNQSRTFTADRLKSLALGPIRDATRVGSQVRPFLTANVVGRMLDFDV